MEQEHPRKWVQEDPDKPAFIMAMSGQVVTRLQLEESANQCAQMLRDMGLKPGDKIAIYMENCPAFVKIACAASRSGLLYTTISTHLAVPEVEYIVNDCGAKAFFTSLARAEVASQLLDKMPNVAARLMVNGTIPGYEAYEEKVSAFPVDPIPNEMVGLDMLYSSGTTGRPKGIKINVDPLPYGELPDGSTLLIALYGLTNETIYLSPAPLYHAAPLRFVMLTLHVGGKVIIMEKFDTLRSIQLIEEYKVTHSQWVPTMFIRMLKLSEEERKKYDVSSQKIAIHAAAPVPIQVKEQMIDWWGPILFEYYAGTEGNGLCAIGGPAGNAVPHIGRHRGDFETGDEPDDVVCMRADVPEDQRRSSPGRIETPPDRRSGIVREGVPALHVLDLDESDLSEQSGGHHLSGLPHHRIARVVVGQSENESRLVDPRQHLAGLLERVRERLVDDDVEPSIQRSDHQIVMAVVRRHDRHHVGAVDPGGLAVEQRDAVPVATVGIETERPPRLDRSLRIG